MTDRKKDEAAKRRRNRRLKIMDYYMRFYCRPMCKALICGDSKEAQRLATRSIDFKYGVAMADPDGKWQSRFNEVYDSTMQELKEMGCGDERR